MTGARGVLDRYEWPEPGDEAKDLADAILVLAAGGQGN